MKSKEKTKFLHWLNQCALVAIASAGWHIDQKGPYWVQWFREGLTSKQAVERLWEAMLESQRKTIADINPVIFRRV